jgi:predicted DCC family thiol-disulfide oxidoreductase YuxK
MDKVTEYNCNYCYDEIQRIIQDEITKRIEFVTAYQGHHEIITGLQIALAIAKKVNRD